MSADNIKCLTSYRLKNRYIEFVVLFKDGSEYRYKKRINFVIYTFIEHKACYDLYHVLECHNWSSYE